MSGSSSAPAVPSGDTATPPVAATPIESSGSTPGESAAPPAAPAEPPVPELTLRDAVTAAVAPTKEPAEPPAKEPDAAIPQTLPADKKPDPKPEAKPTKTDAEQEAEDKTLPFHQHPRWKTVVGERNAARNEAETLRKEVETHKPKAEELDRITVFLDHYDIAPEEMQGMMRLLALMKTEPATALQELRKIVAPLESFVGDVLPPDLQKEVDEGVTTPERARELVRARNQAEFVSKRGERDLERTQQAQSRDMAMACGQAVSEWERQIAAADPDYKSYGKWVAVELKRLNAATPARTPAEAVELAKQAYDSVSKEFRSALQRGRTQTPTTPRSTDTRGAPGHTAPPTSMKEVVRRATGE